MTDLVYVPQAEMLRLRSNRAAFVAAARINVLSMITEAGAGHLGSSFSALDIYASLLLEEMAPDDVLISSKGHDVPALYAVLHGLGRVSDDALHTLRQPGGLPGHPEPGAVPGMLFSTGSLGMGISKAKGLILADRLAGRTRKVWVVCGDGEMQEGQVWEALRDERDYPELQVVVDHNGWQTGELQTLAPYWLTLRGRLNNPKGKGVSFMEADPVRWHSGAPNEQEYERALWELLIELDRVAPPVNEITSRVPHVWPEPKGPDPLIEAYAQALVEAAERDPRIVVLDADLAGDCGLIPFRERFPDRFVECGIAEQDMVSMATGLAAGGYLPICHSFAAFLTRRACDQIWNARQEHRPLILVGMLAGTLPSNGPGPSHYSGKDDVLAWGCLGIRVFTVGRPRGMPGVLALALESATPVYLRFPTREARCTT